MSRAFPRGPAKVGFNLTAMIDVTFLMIMFFLLVAQPEVEPGPKEIELPAPVDSAGREPTGIKRIEIDVLPAERDAGRARAYQVSGESVGLDLDELAARIAREVRENPEAAIDVRADRRTEFAAVGPVLAALREAGAREVNLYVEGGEDDASDR